MAVFQAHLPFPVGRPFLEPERLMGDVLNHSPSDAEQDDTPVLPLPVFKHIWLQEKM